MDKILLSPPVAFLIILAVTLGCVRLMSGLAFKRHGDIGGQEKSYACGEDVSTNLMQPDYSQFFPFAFFFTILHVVTLMVTTAPIETTGSLIIAVIYLLGAAVALLTLFRR
ncbi:MAG: hypothetical protein WC592_06670 [Candidatus Omnitrophota bacterium]|nr:hypothetical protein [Candidatus Omnitrophota bacterium]